MNFFKFFGKTKNPTASAWQRQFRAEGIFLSQNNTPSNADNTSAITSPGLAGYLTQLADDALAVQDAQGAENNYFVPWDAYYQAAQDPSYADLPTVLAMPATTQMRPALSSRNALVDSDFSISLGLWRAPDGRQVAPVHQGALLNVSSTQELMTAAQWQLTQQVLAFAARTETHKAAHSQELAWGRIRKTALAAQADMSDFLIKTVVLTPERLDMAFRRSKAVVGDTVIEVIPGFDGAPADWIEEFDRFTSAQDRYQFALPDGGLIQVVVSPQVKAVLQEIKRLPGRRVAGSRAQAFLLNPFATLGEAAAAVLDEKQFEQARTDAGLQFERFTAWVEPDATGYPSKVGILVDSTPAADAPATHTVLFNDAELPQFIARLESAVHQGMQLAFWEGYELEILGDTEDQLALLKAALAQRLQPQTLVTYAQIHDLSGYSARIEGVGIDKPYYSPFIAKKKDDEGWFPDNVFPILAYTPAGASEPVTVPVNDAALKQLKEAIEKAAAAGQDTVKLAWLPQPMPLAEAEHITKTFAEVFADVKKGTFTPDKLPAPKPAARKTLVLLANIDTVDFDAQRRQALSLQTPAMHAPRSLNPAYPLLAHQRDGVARMQYLYGLREKYRVRGLVLGDDMGLGKTLQLLTLAASIFELEPNTAPMLVVAPVSLLENWQEEAEKFFPGALRVLTAYGDNLRPLRVPRESIDEKLRTEDGLVKFLKPGWVGNAQLVLTTYETLRDLEFSFALEKWSIMVCDEAQRIKNPAAMVTRAAKKQNASFKIACTGTPVENTLADLWCLFDFVQPGLLGALNDFGKRYRRPIEIDERDAEGLARVEELREKIQPQMLRRTKLEVIDNLPKKIIDESCRRLAMSPLQRNFYARAIADFRQQRQQPADSAFRSPFKNHLGLLQYLRLVCTDPKQHGLTVFKPEPLGEYRKNAPKLDWLLVQLKAIQAKGEKAIVFCEFRAIQRLLQHYIFEAFGFKADIINGDTSAASSSADSRQKRIKAFQAAQGFGVIILSPVAVGFGVNIQGANHVVHYTRTWNPAKEDQASDRAWRIGQKKDVYIYYPVVAAEDFTTFDVKLDQLLERKRALAGDMLNGSPDISTAEFLIEEVIPHADAHALSESVTLDVAMRMEWRYFEGLAAALWLKQGFDTVYCTPGSGDNGVDVVAIRGNVGALVQVKTSANDSRALGWDAVKEVVTGEAFYQRKHPGVSFVKVGLTNQTFNQQAHENADLNQVRLLERPQLEQMLQQHPVTMLEVERLLYAQLAEI